MAAQASQAALAGNEQGQVRQGPVGQVGEHLLHLGMVTVVFLGLEGGERGVGEDGVVAPGAEQFVLALGSFATQAVGAARATGCTGTLVALADSAFYSAAFTGAVRRAGAFFSVTVPMDPKVKAAIAAIPETAWTPIRYPRAIWDDQSGRWVSDAQVAKVPYTAFTSKKGGAVTARLIVRRVKGLNRKAGGTAGGGRVAAAQPGGGDHGCRQRRVDRRGQRVQPAYQQAFPWILV